MELLLPAYVLWSLGSALVGLVIYWLSSKNHTYWKDRGVPSVPALPFIGSLFGRFSKPMQVSEEERYKEFGRIYGRYEGNRPALTVGEPDLVRNILVKDFHYFVNRRSVVTGDPVVDNMVNIVDGDHWKRLRTIITPTFTTGKIKRMLNIFEECAKTLAQNLLAAAEGNDTFDGKKLFGGFSMDVIASSAFSTKLDSHNNPSNKFVLMARNIFSRGGNWRAVGLFLCPKLMTFFRFSIMNPEVTSFFKDLTLQIMAERKRTGTTKNDFLQLLMDTAKEEISKEEASEKESIESNYNTEENNDVFKQYIHKKSLSLNELVAQCVIFFLAGYDTTASTLSFTSYNLALHPEVQDRLRKEIDEAIAEAEGQITYEAVQKMKYLDNVISETLRLYPPAIRLERKAGDDYKLGDTGITIPKGMIVNIPAYCMHRDPEFFPEPEKFDPERFTPEAKASRNPYTYLPFGAGPRNCIGMRFALMEVKVCMVYILSHFKIMKSPETKVPLDYYIGAGLLQPKEVPLMVKIRVEKVLKS